MGQESTNEMRLRAKGPCIHVQGFRAPPAPSRAQKPVKDLGSRRREGGGRWDGAGSGGHPGLSQRQQEQGQEAEACTGPTLLVPHNVV